MITRICAIVYEIFIEIFHTLHNIYTILCIKYKTNINDYIRFVCYLQQNEYVKRINGKKELVIGIYEGLEIMTLKGGIEIFLKSLRNHNKNCAIVIWCNKKSYTDDYKKMEQIYDCSFLLYDLFTNTHHLQTRRLYLTYIFLKMYNSFEKILCADMNDIYFQNNPFKIDLQNKNLYIALEANHFSKKNSSTRCNECWLRKLKISKNQYMDEFVICSGTLYGNYDGIFNYLDWVFNNRFYIYPQYHGLDQGYFMEYVYFVINKKDCIITEINKSLILTCDNITKLSFNANNCIINDDNIEYIIVHQIDRTPECLPHIYKVLSI